MCPRLFVSKTLCVQDSYSRCLFYIFTQSFIIRFKEFQYNIPFDLENINILKLEQQIDEYEELLTTAREQGIDWDISQYDPVHLSQVIDDQESYYRQERNDLYSCFAATRGLEA